MSAGASTWHSATCAGASGQPTGSCGCVCRQKARSLLLVVQPHRPNALEPPTADPRIIWDIYFSSHILPVVALADEKGVFTLLEAAPLSVPEAAAQAAGQRRVGGDHPRHSGGAAARAPAGRSLPQQRRGAQLSCCRTVRSTPGYTLRRFAPRNVWERLKNAIGDSVRRREPLRVGRRACTSCATGKRTSGRYSAPKKACARCTACPSRRRWPWPATPTSRPCAPIAGRGRRLGRLFDALAQRYPDIRCSVAELPVVCQVTGATSPSTASKTGWTRSR